MPDLSLLLGAAVFASGMLAGRFWPARRKGPKPVKERGPICGCGHHASFHVRAVGACHGNGGYCRCQIYTGPTPMPEYYAPEIGG